jgi:hypothetical protein
VSPFELDQLAEHFAPGKGREGPTARKPSTGLQLTGNLPLLLRLDLKHTHLHHIGSFPRQVSREGIKPRGSRLPGVVPPKQNEGGIGLLVGTNYNSCVHLEVSKKEGPGEGGPGLLTSADAPSCGVRKMLAIIPHASESNFARRSRSAAAQ